MLKLGKIFEKLWYTNNIICYLLLPFSLLFLFCITFRKFIYKLLYSKKRFKKKYPVPIIVVGNITVGGTGKTPMVIYLVNLLRKHGRNPGIITRGYKGKNKSVNLVGADSTVFDFGDEAILLHKLTHAKVMVGVNRRKAVKKLLELDSSIDVIISDDGLQHYKLPRDYEIVMCDDVKGFGNGFLLPAGPLRELPCRLKSVNFVVVNKRSNFELESAGENTSCKCKEKTCCDCSDNFQKIIDANVAIRKQHQMELVGNKVFNLVNPGVSLALKDFSKRKVHAVCAIGNNESFFQKLQSFEIDIIKHPFIDHHFYVKEDLEFEDEHPIIMTTKDAIKCMEFPAENMWVNPVEAKLDKEFETRMLLLLKKSISLVNRIKNILGIFKRKSNE